MPVLAAGHSAADFARLVEQRFGFQMARVYVCDPATHRPVRGSSWLSPGSAVELCALPLHCHPRTPARTWRATGGARLPRALTAGHARDLPASPNPRDPADPADPVPDMPFYAVRRGWTPGLYLSKADMRAQTESFPGAECDTFATLEEARRYLQRPDVPAAAAVRRGLGLGLGLDSGSGLGPDATPERQLMSAGSKARHPPPVDVRPHEAAVARADASVIEVLVEGVVVPELGGVFGADVFASADRSARVRHVACWTEETTPSRLELLAALEGVQRAVAREEFVEGSTTVRVFSASTYATNAINDYCRRKGAFRGANADALEELRAALRNVHVTAHWLPTTHAELTALRTGAVEAARQAAAAAAQAAVPRGAKCKEKL